jgi:L-rhamnose mutarotase
MSLFAVLRLRPDNKKDALPLQPVMKRWWDYMADLMEVHPDNKPVEWPLKPVFYFEG